MIEAKVNLVTGALNSMKRYVINLDRSEERLTHIKSVFTKEGLDFTRVKAVDGHNLSQEDYDRLTQTSIWPKPLTKAEVACFLSHRECWRLIAEGDDPYGAVFEDDVKLSPHAHLFLTKFDWIPEGCDIVKLDTAEIACVLGKFNKELLDGYKLAPFITKHYCSGGYIISKSCAKRLYDENKQITAPVDEIMYNPECGVFSTLNIEQMFPAIVVQIGLSSTILYERKTIKGPKHSRRTMPEKMKRELKRFKKRYLIPWALKTFRGCFWGVVPFH